MAILFIKVDLKICILCFLMQLKSGNADKETYTRLPSVVTVVGRPFEYFISGLDKNPEQYEVSIHYLFYFIFPHFIWHV